MPSTTQAALFRLRVHLIDSAPEIWRLIEIDADLRLDAVHTVLQIAMGWENSHLHTFEDVDPYTRWKPGQPKPHRWGPRILRQDDEDLLPEEDYTLRETLTQDRPLFYEYDLGDGWQHCITLIEILPKKPNEAAVTVIRGERRCPLEDSGGIEGYEELLTIITDPSHEDHHDRVEWVTQTTGQPAGVFDPTQFDADATNRELREHFPRDNTRAR